MVFILASQACFSQYTKDRYHVKDTLSKYQVSSYSIYKILEDGNDSILLEILEFDRYGNLIKEYEPRYDITISYKYDSFQREKERHTYCPGISNETVYLYYSENNLIKEIKKDSTGKITQERAYEYKDSRLSKERVESSYGSHSVTYEYDSTGLFITKLSPDYSRRTEIQQNEYGGIIYFEMVDSLNKGPKPVWFSYNKNLRTEEYHFFNNEKIKTEKMIYDPQGRILEIQYCGDVYRNYPCTPAYRFYYKYFEE